MAERIEEPEAEGASEAGIGPISPAAAMAIGGRRQRAGARLDPKLDAFLDRQTLLTELQTEHLHEQRELVLSRLRWGRFSDRMKALLQVMTALVGLAVVVGVGAMAWSASRDRSLVIEPFSAPPALAQSGATGQVVAADVMERMDAMRRPVAARSFAASNDVTADKQDDVKLEIPETGMSVGELSRALRRWLGAQRIIEGSLRQQTDGRLRLEAHLAGHDPVAAVGAPTELETLEQKLAEQLYAQVDPVNWANYLEWSGRRAEASAATAALPGSAPDEPHRAGAYALWANHTHDPLRARSLARIAVTIDPKLTAGWYEITRTERGLGHDEAALADARRGLATRDQDQTSDLRGAGFRQMRANLTSSMDELAGDFAGARDLALSGSSLTPGARQAAALHDGAAGRIVAVDAAARALAPLDRLSVQVYADLAADDWPTAARDAAQLLADEEQARAAAADDDERGRLWWNEQVRDRPRLAEARMRLGDVAGAQAAIAPTPLDCYPCLRERGRIATAARDWAGAERWFAEAVRQGPSLPFAYGDWGQMLLAKGDPRGALAKLRLAHEKSTQWADALELRGEALLATGDSRGAAATFAEAGKHAPSWGRTHLMWGEALMLAGRYAEARKQYEAANGLDLSRPDRAALNVLLARTSKGPLHG